MADCGGRRCSVAWTGSSISSPTCRAIIPILNICLTKKFGFSGLHINTAGAFVDSSDVDAVALLAAKEIR